MVVSGLEIIINVHDITTDISDFMRVGFIRGLNASSIVNHDESFPLIRINCSRPIVSSSRRNRCRSYLFRPRFNFQGNEKPRISARLTMFFILLSIRSQLNGDVNYFQRKFVNEVRRCDEMERKLRYIEAEVRKDGVPIVDNLAELPRAPNPRMIIDLEVRFFIV